MRRSAVAIVAVVVGLGCHKPASGEAPSAPPSTAPQAARPPREPTKFELVEGNDVNVGSGVTVRLKTVMFSHLADSRSDSLLSMDVTRAGKHEGVMLNRLTPGEPTFKEVMGLQMAVDYVDAYHQPVTGAILVR